MRTIYLTLAVVNSGISFATAADTPAESPRAGFWVADNLVDAVAIADGILYLGGSFTTLGVNCGSFAVLAEDDSRPRVPAATVNGEVHAVTSDGLGGWIIGGTFDIVGGETHRYLARILADGSVADWDAKMDFEVECILVDGSTVYVGGPFVEVNGVDRRRAAAVDLGTGDLLPWNPSANGTVFTIAKQGDVVYLGGQFTSMGGQTRNGIAAVDADTGALLPWNPDATPAAVWDIEPSEDAIYVGGNFDMIGGGNRNRLAALDPTTGNALAFNPNMGGTVLALALNGTSLYAGGVFAQVGGAPRSCIAEIDVTTGLATAWNPNAMGGDGMSTSIQDIVFENQQVYVCGSFSSIGGASRKHAAVLDPSTGLASSFGADFDGTDSTLAYDMAVSENEIAVGGKFSLVGATPRARLAAIDLDTGELLPWNPAPNAAVKDLLVRGTTLHVGGLFTHIAGEDRRFLAAFDTSTGDLTNFDSQITTITGYVAILEAVGSTLFVGGDFQDFVGGRHVNLAAVDADTGAPRSWDMDAGGPVLALEVDEATDTLFVGGRFTNVTRGNISRNYIAAFDSETGALRSFAPAMHRAVLSLAANDGTLYAGGEFESVGGIPRGYLAAFDITTGFLTGWNPAITGGSSSRAAFEIDVHRNQVFVGGDFEFINGQHRPYVAALDPVTGAPDPWLPNVNRTVWSIDAVGDVLAIGGEFTQVGGRQNPYMALFDFQSFTADPFSFEVVIGGLIDGDVSDLLASDDSYVHTRSGFGRTFTDLHNMTMIVDAATTATLPAALNLSIESRIDEPAGMARIRLWNWNTNQFSQVGTYSIGTTERVDTISGIPAENYVNVTGQIRLSIKHNVVVPIFAFIFESYIDHVVIEVQ